MSVPPEVAEVLRRWVRKAEHDLQAARLILTGENNCPYDTACFHCHQAAEKYLKALLTMLGIQAPRTHDLGKLLALLPGESRLSVQAAQLVAMNPYAVEVRYADDWLEPQREEALRSLELAERVGTEARRLLPPEVLI
jgi:HEPN domain-containing protein